MKRIPIFIFLSAMFQSNAAWAQQRPSPQVEVSPDVRQMCRQEVRRICRPGLVPNRTAIQRCMAENKDKLPKQCLTIFQNN